MRRRWALILLGVTVIAVAVFIVFPRLDIALSKMALRGDGHFLLYYERNTYLLHLALQYVVPVVIVFFVVAGIAWRLGRPVWGITAWQALFVILAFAIGPGLVVNVMLKNNSHRPRPANVQEFGGANAYAPPFDFSGACDTNCSFVAGDPAMGFGFLAVALLLPPARRNRAAAGAIGLGAAIGLMRILWGAHFFSDVVFSGIATCAAVLALHWAMFTADGAPRGRWGRQLSLRA